MRLLTIALNTIYHVLRMKLAIVFVLFLVVVLVTVPFSLKSDGTQKGRVQITLAYSLGVLNIIMSLLTLFLSTSTFFTDIRNRVIFTIDTKPVRRWEILGGKWLGIIVVDAALLVCLGGAIYGTTMYIGRTLKGKEQEHFDLRREVLTARAGVKPTVPRKMKKQSSVVAFQHEKEWVFENIRLTPVEKTVTLKFRYYNAGATGQEVSGLWTIGSKDSAFYRHVTTLPAKSFHEFQVPAATISPDGKLRVSFLNLTVSGMSVIFPVDDVTVLYHVGSFGGNFFRAMLLILSRLAFIAVVGLTSSTFLTFPVATLLSLFVLTMSLSVPSIEALLGSALSPESSAGTGTSMPTTLFARKAVMATLKLLPDLKAYDPVSSIVSGVLIRWQQVISAFIGIVLVRSGIIGLLGYVIFNRRELADMGYL